MDNRPTRAHRRPESIQRQGMTRQQQNVQNRQNAQTHQSGQTPARPAQTNPPQTRQSQPRQNDYRFQAGTVRRTGANPQSQRQNRNPKPAQQRSVVRHVSDLSRDERAVAEAKKELALRKKSRKWLANYEKDKAALLEEQAAEKTWQEEVVRYRGGVDLFMTGIILLLIVLGTITVFSASYPIAVYEGDDPTSYIKRQLMYVGLGLVVGLFAIIIEPKFYKKWLPFIIYAAGTVLLIAVLFIGTTEGVTQRWISIGGFFNIQPSEIMKVGVIFMLAWYADKYEEAMYDITLDTWSQYRFNVLYPGMLLGFACALFLVGKHLSGFAIVAAIGFLMMIISTKRVKWLICTVIPLALAVGIVYLILNPYALRRITAAVDETPDTLGAMYQSLKSTYAIGSGGLLGVGLGEGRQKYHFLTQSHTDFIFSVWCEETGFVGAAALIILFLLFIWRGYTIALRAPDKFSMLLAFGITTHVGIQAFLHMMVTTGLFVNTGVTFPFFSYGGSSLIVLMAEMGVLLCISRQYYRKKSDVEREQIMKQMGME